MSALAVEAARRELELIRREHDRRIEEFDDIVASQEEERDVALARVNDLEAESIAGAARKGEIEARAVAAETENARLGESLAARDTQIAEAVERARDAAAREERRVGQQELAELRGRLDAKSTQIEELQLDLSGSAPVSRRRMSNTRPPGCN